VWEVGKISGWGVLGGGDEEVFGVEAGGAEGFGVAAEEKEY
jgi:hypothetical protein